MDSYGVGEVERMLHLSRSTIRGLISRGFVSPARGPRREYRFSFQDLVILRTARALVQAKVSPRRIGRSLSALRRQLPKSVPLTGLTICSVGSEVVVRKGGDRWQPESGQYLLGFDVAVAGDSLQITELKPGGGRAGGAGGGRGLGAAGGGRAGHAADGPGSGAAGDAGSLASGARTGSVPGGRGAGAAGGLGGGEQGGSLQSARGDMALEAHTWFERGVLAEERDVAKALEAYERCRALDARHTAARINLGRLLHEAGRLDEAQRVYREALREPCEPDPTLLFNLGVLLEDSSRNAEAIEAYQQALGEDPDFADAHYNLARLYEAAGKPQHAIRHLGIYRRLLKS